MINNNNSKDMKRLLTSAAMFLCSLLTFAQFSGSGSGIESDPYLILNPIQLNQMRNFLNQSGVYFKLMADIDLTEFLEDEYPSHGWQPVGTASAPFQGILDGNGKTISGLIINRNSSDNVGLFAYVNNSEIKNLTIKAHIIGFKCVGALAGNAKGNNNFSNIYLEGTIQGNAYVGGLIGTMEGSEKKNCTNIVVNVKVQATNNYVGCMVGEANKVYFTGCRIVNSCVSGDSYVGGICGHYGQCIDCSFVGSVIGNSYVGGISGSKCGIKKCYALGTISATGDYVGGLIGSDLSNIGETESYFCGTVSGRNYVGGIAGSCGYLKKSYANALVKGVSKVGGICGNHNISEISKCVYSGTSLYATEGEIARIIGAGTGDVGEMGTDDENKALNRSIVIKAGVAQDVIDNKQNGTGVSATTLKHKATYVAMSWDFTDTWEIQETESYPYFKTQTAPPVITSDVVSGATTISGKCVSGATVTLDIDGVKQEKVFGGTTFSFSVDPLQAGHEVRVSAKVDGKEQSYFTTAIVSYLGNGTEVDPYQISTAADLTQVYRKGYYKLMNDIDLTSYINQFSPSEGWQSIGRDGSETIHFDGDGHKITGLWCNTTRDNTGLFSCFANGYIKNLTVETANGKQVKGGANTGILIGKMINGTVENCHVSGNLSDGTPVGGIVGLMDNGNILKCQADVTINTTGETSYIGGLVGEITAGEINQCYTKGALTATGSESYVGGLVGKNSSTITNCHSSAVIHSTYNAAGLIAYNYNVVEKSYATGDLFSNNYAAGVIGYNDGTNAVVRNCAAMNNKIDVVNESQQVQQGGGYGQRIIGGIKNSAPAPDLNNYALKTMQVSVNDVTQKVYDDIMNGVAKTNEELTNVNTYEGIGWDFTNVWKMPETTGYPLLQVGSYEGTEGGYTPGGDDPQTEYFSASSVKVMTGKQQEVNIALDNESEIIMIEFELQLPSGITIAKDEDDEFLTELVSTRVAKSHTLEVADKGDGKYKFLLYSSSNTPIKGNNGDLITFTINCDKNVAEGTYQAKATSILLADKNEKAIYPSDFTIDITVVDAIPGDVNGDEKINGLDIVKIVGYIMGSPTQPFVEAAADLNEDGVINGLDLVKLVSLVLEQSSSTSSNAKALGNAANNSVQPMSIINKGKNMMTVGVDDSRQFLLAQLTLETAPDIKISDITTDGGHTVAYKKVAENRYNVVCYSQSNKSFAYNCEMLKITYTGSGSITLSNALLIDAQENEVRFGAVTSGEPTDIEGVVVSEQKPADIYTLSGKLVRKSADTLQGLPQGTYIVNGQKINIK